VVIFPDGQTTTISDPNPCEVIMQWNQSEPDRSHISEGR
jgi:hypothetical protein